jgi:hypothetical protein
MTNKFDKSTQILIGYPICQLIEYIDAQTTENLFINQERYLNTTNVFLPQKAKTKKKVTPIEINKDGKLMIPYLLQNMFGEIKYLKITSWPDDLSEIRNSCLEQLFENETFYATLLLLIDSRDKVRKTINKLPEEEGDSRIKFTTNVNEILNTYCEMLDHGRLDTLMYNFTKYIIYKLCLKFHSIHYNSGKDITKIKRIVHRYDIDEILADLIDDCCEEDYQYVLIHKIKSINSVVTIMQEIKNVTLVKPVETPNKVDVDVQTEAELDTDG